MNVVHRPGHSTRTGALDNTPGLTPTRLAGRSRFPCPQRRATRTPHPDMPRHPTRTLPPPSIGGGSVRCLASNTSIRYQRVRLKGEGAGDGGAVSHLLLLRALIPPWGHRFPPSTPLYPNPLPKRETRSRDIPMACRGFLSGGGGDPDADGRSAPWTRRP